MINYNENNEGMRTATAVKYANKYLAQGHPFYDHYTSPQFVGFNPDMADTNLMNIILLMSGYVVSGQIEVKHWKPWNRWTKAIAMTNLNVRRMYRPTGSILNTIVHETVHIVDSHHSYSFGHGTGPMANYSKGKEKTAPYLLGRLAEEYYESGKLYDYEELQAL
jgi:hypothetical protein